MAKPSLNYYRTLHVGKAKTDVIQFTTIQAATDAITDNDATHRYAVYVHPGTYTEKITMEDYIDLIAIGGREETIITFVATVAGDPTVTGENSMIKGFTIITDSTNFTGRCVENAVAGFEMDDCVLSIDNHDGAEVVLQATAAMDMRRCVIDLAANGLTAVNLDTATEDYNIDDCKIGGGTNSVIVTNADNVAITRSTLYNLFDHDACATGTVVRGSILEEIDFDGGTLNLYETYVETIAADTGGTVVAYGGTIRNCSSVSVASFVWWLDDDNLHVLENMLIQDAITAASAGDTIHLDGVTYAERITMKDGVHIEGANDSATVISDNTNAAVVTAGAVTCVIRRVKFIQTDVTAIGSYTLSVTGAADLNFSHCRFDCDATDAIHMVNGTVKLDECIVEDGNIDLSTAACTLLLDHSQMTAGDIVTLAAEALNHSITCLHSDFNNNSITNNATGATALEIRFCSDINTITDAGLLGTTNIENSMVLTATKTGTSGWLIRLARISTLSNNNATGDIIVYGGYIGACGGATGSVVWWHDNANELMVISGMLIAHAIAAAGATGDTIKIGQGTWAESNLVIEKSINFIGEGPEESIVSASSANPIFQVGDVTTDTAVVCTFQGLEIRNDAGGEAIELVAGVDGAGPTTVVVRECRLDSAGGNAVALAAAGDAAKTFEAFETSFHVMGWCIDIDATVAADIDLHNCEVISAGGLANLTGANHTFDAWDCECGGGTLEVSGNAPTINLTRCNDVGAITNLTGAMVIEHCTTGAISTTTGAVTIEHSNIGILSSGNATVNVYNSYVTEANPSDGTQTFYDCVIGTVDSDGGAIVVHGGDILIVDTPVTGTVVWWEGDHILKVMASTGNMKIADALAVASAGDTIKVGQGTFAESNLTAVDEVDIVGEGYEISVIEATNNTQPIITVGSGVTCTFRGVKISNLGTHATVAVTAGAAAASLTVRDCLLKSDAANSIVTVGTTGAGAPSFDASLSVFDTGADAITVTGAVVATVNVRQSVFTSCTLAFSTTGANHSFTIDDCDFGGGGVTLSANVPVVSLSKCEDIGAFTHNTASTVSARFCYFSSTYTVGAVLAVAHCHRCYFVSTVTNGGTGALHLNECAGAQGLTNSSTGTVYVWGGWWTTVTQGAAAGTIDFHEAFAEEVACGAGGVMNYHNCEVMVIDTNAGTITVYGGTILVVADATGTLVWWEAPHRLRVIAADANMKIMDAADAATAGDTILIGPGTFTEALDLDDAAKNACTYKGFGRDKTIITQPTGNTVLVDGITGVVFEDLTINLTAGATTDAALKLDGSTNATASVILRNVEINATWTAGTTYGIWAIDNGTRVATVEAHNCKISATGGASSYAVAANTCTTGTSTISLYDCILNGLTYDIYNDRITIDTHDCELNGAGWWIQNNATAIGLAYNNEAPATVTPVTFAGAAGEFADLTGAELYTCLATVLIGEAVYIDAANHVAEATNAAAAPISAEGIVVYKPAGAAGTECYVKNSGMLYMATPPAVWAAGTNVWLGAAGAQLVARPANALKQVLGVGVDTKRMLVNIAPVEVVLKKLTIPIAWGAGSGDVGTHIDDVSYRAVTILDAINETCFSQAVDIPEDFLSFSKLYLVVIGTGTGSFDCTCYASAAGGGHTNEDEGAHRNSQAYTAPTTAVTDDYITWVDVNATVNFTMVENDVLSTAVKLTGLTTTTQVLVLKWELEYNAQRGA